MVTLPDGRAGRIVRSVSVTTYKTTALHNNLVALAAHASRPRSIQAIMTIGIPIYRDDFTFRCPPNDTKVIIVGDESVGKTSSLSQFNNHSFENDTKATLGALFLAKQVQTSHGVVSLLMWDTASQERYRSLIPMYAREASAAILVVDVRNQQSLKSLEHWYETLVENCPEKTLIYIVANKMDLPQEIDLAKVENFAKQHSRAFFKTCAMEYDSVEPIFLQIGEDFARITSAVTPFAKTPVRAPPVPGNDGCC
jgi:Ras-related protein Rab-6A